MFDATINFTALLTAALIVGAMFGFWLILDPAGLDAGSYVTQQQIGIRKLNTVMPLLGALLIILTAWAAILARDDRVRLTLLIAAVICFVAAGVITRFGNQPINAIVMTWQAGSAPVEWTQLRDAWWRWHILRLCSGLAGLSLMIVATLVR
ncbi:MAG TPA: DUF1772 domain-containing protein [Aestuariivirga sp.]